MTVSSRSIMELKLTGRTGRYQRKFDDRGDRGKLAYGAGCPNANNLVIEITEVMAVDVSNRKWNQEYVLIFSRKAS